MNPTAISFRVFMTCGLLLATSVTQSTHAGDRQREQAGANADHRACITDDPDITRFELRPNSWAFVLNFNVLQDGKPVSCLLIRGDSTEHPPTAHLDVCEMVGSRVAYNAGSASFDGKTYLRCPFRLSEFVNETGYPEKIVERLTSMADFWMYAHGRFGKAERLSPIVRHPKFQLNATTTNLQRATLSMTSRVGLSASGSFNEVVPGMDSYRLLSYCNFDHTDCKPAHSVNNQLISARKASDQEFYADTGEMDFIYIGGGPGSSAALDGVLHETVIDPECCW